MTNYSKAPKYAKTNDSITGRHDIFNPGPEHSQYDIGRHEMMKLRYPGRVLSTTGGAILLCSGCEKEIYTSDSVIIDGIPYHGDCYNARHKIAG